MSFRPWEADLNAGVSTQEEIMQPFFTTKKRCKFCETCKEIILNVHEHCVKVIKVSSPIIVDGIKMKPPSPVSETSKIIRVNKTTIRNILKSGPVPPKKRGRKMEKLRLADNFECDIVRRTVYRFYANKKLPTLDMILQDLQTNTDFPYKRTSLCDLLRKLGFRYKKLNKRKILLESLKFQVWRFEYITKLRRARLEGREVVYLDETWYDTCDRQDSIKRGWAGCSCASLVDSPSSTGERIIVLHAGSKNGWVENGLMLTSKQMIDAGSNHCDMTTALFENWFVRLLQNLAPNSVIVMDNATYHSRLSLKIPNKATKKEQILDFMRKFDIHIPEPVPTVPVLLDIVKKTGIEKKYVVDELAAANGCEVVRLPPYHCSFNPIEQVWTKLKDDIKAKNSNPDSKTVCQLIMEAVKTITPDLWNTYVEYAIKIENKYFRADEKLDSNSDAFVKLGYAGDSGDSDSSDDDDDDE